MAADGSIGAMEYRAGSKPCLCASALARIDPGLLIRVEPLISVLPV
jgi:hypothetical protein